MYDYRRACKSRTEPRWVHGFYSDEVSIPAGPDLWPYDVHLVLLGPAWSIRPLPILVARSQLLRDANECPGHNYGQTSSRLA